MAAQVTPFLPKPIDGASSTTENPLQEVRVINATEESVVAEVPPYPCLDIVFCDTREGSSIIFKFRGTMKIKDEGHNIRKTPDVTSDTNIICKVKRSEVLYISTIKDGWGKLHESMYDILKDREGFQAVDIKTEGWCELVSYFYLDSMTTERDPAFLKLCQSESFAAYNLPVALEPENGSKRCGRIKRGDLVLATGAKDGFVKLHPLMYGQPLCYSKDFSPFDISSQGWVRTYGDHQLSEDGDDELPEEQVFFQSMHHILLLGTANSTLRYISSALIILQAVLICCIIGSVYDEGTCPKKFDDGVMYWVIGCVFCSLYGAASIREDYCSSKSVLEFAGKNKTGSKGPTWYLSNDKIIFLMYFIDCLATLAMCGIMASSEDLKDLVSNFIGIAVVFQCDELLASVLKIPCPEPDLYKTKEKKKSYEENLWVIIIIFVMMLGWIILGTNNPKKICEDYKSN